MTTRAYVVIITEPDAGEEGFPGAAAFRADEALARAAITSEIRDAGLATERHAWEAGANALAAVMPEPEE